MYACRPLLTSLGAATDGLLDHLILLTLLFLTFASWEYILNSHPGMRSLEKHPDSSHVGTHKSAQHILGPGSLIKTQDAVFL